MQTLLNGRNNILPRIGKRPDKRRGECAVLRAATILGTFDIHQVKKRIAAMDQPSCDDLPTALQSSRLGHGHVQAGGGGGV